MTVVSGLSNIALDALFIAVFRWGLIGAAVATSFSQYLGAVIPIVYFLRPNQSLLRLSRFKFDGKALLRTVTNGSSEMVNNISMSVVSMLYNLQLLAYAGEDGVAAYSVIMYVNLIFMAIFIGYVIGAAPLIGFNHGAQNHGELKNVTRKSLVILTVSSVAMVVFAVAMAKPLSAVFVGYDAELEAMTIRAFMIYSLSFLLCGFNIFGSSMFTALNNGLISAVISFLRTLVFQIAAVMLLPMIWELDGIWLSVVVAELVALILTGCFFFAYRKRYHYA
jgi:Na+-driven multidrug efflux pump